MDREALEKLISSANSLTTSTQRQFSSKSKTAQTLKNREKRAPTTFHSLDDGEDGVKGIQSTPPSAYSAEGDATSASVETPIQKSAPSPSPKMTPPTIKGGGSSKKLSKSSLNSSTASNMTAATTPSKTPSRLSEDVTAGTIEEAEKAIAAITSEIGMAKPPSSSEKVSSMFKKFRGGGSSSATKVGSQTKVRQSKERLERSDGSM